MKTVGIICEYNPFHLGHKRQFDMIRAQQGDDSTIVCLMSGNYVQRGAPAIFDKSLRARAAIDCGADLVLELPVIYALSSAEGFAAGGVGLLGGFCDALCFGTESGTKRSLLQTAQGLLSPEFSPALRAALESGCSFPAARTAALEHMGLKASLLQKPNDILAVEYCKAILSRGCSMEPMPIRRDGGYHDTAPNPENPSATAIRAQILDGHDLKSYVPAPAWEIFSNAKIHTMTAGERAILARLRSMTDEEFEALPYGSEGLWRKLMHACREFPTLEEIAAAVKSKRYTRTRIDRMILCAYLGITKERLKTPFPYCRVLGFNNRGRAALKKARTVGTYLHVGDATGSPWWTLERRWDDLYGLFNEDAPDRSGGEEKRRVYFAK